SRTRARAPASASATTRKRRSVNSSDNMKPIPHEHGQVKRTPLLPAFIEGRAGNEPAVSHERFHVRSDYAIFEVASPHRRSKLASHGDAKRARLDDCEGRRTDCIVGEVGAGCGPVERDCATLVGGIS